jgi:hypothetical protein
MHPVEYARNAAANARTTSSHNRPHRPEREHPSTTALEIVPRAEGADHLCRPARLHKEPDNPERLLALF